MRYIIYIYILRIYHCKRGIGKIISIDIETKVQIYPKMCIQYRLDGKPTLGKIKKSLLPLSSSFNAIVLNNSTPHGNVLFILVYISR